MARKPVSVAVFAAVAIALLATACSDGGSNLQTDRGQVRILLAGGAEPAALATESTTWGGDDAPRIESARVTFSSILARNLDGQLIDVTAALPVTVDLLTLFDGRTVELPSGFLPPGTYDQVVVVMTKVELLLAGGGEVAITPPGGGWTAVVPAEPFTVVEGEVTTVTLRLRATRLFEWLGDRFDFHPDFDCEVDD